MIPENISNHFTHAILVTGSRTWDDEAAMRQTFNKIWKAWNMTGPQRPVLLSGACPTGADRIAENLFEKVGFEIMRFPADWSQHGRTAGFRRNAQMVNAAQVFIDSGVDVVCAAFLDYCNKAHCARNHQQQLLPQAAGHYSHGTTHCRGLAVQAGIEVVDTFAVRHRSAVRIS